MSPKVNNRGQKVIIYEKKIWNDYYYLEAINNKWFLETQTMYINK